LNGLGTIRSCSLAVKLLKTVAERGHWAEVLTRAHRHYLNGEIETAWLLYAQAAEEGFEVAQSNSAFMLHEPDGTGEVGLTRQRQYEIAYRHLTFASEQDNVDALRQLGDYAYYGHVYMGGITNSTTTASTAASTTKTTQTATAATATVTATATTTSGSAVTTNSAGTASSPADSTALVVGSSSHPPPQPDLVRAARYYLLAAEKRNARAMFNLGYMHEMGYGLPRDWHLAKRYYDLALDTAPEAYIPAKLALLKLQAVQYWERFTKWWSGTSESTSATTSTASSSSASTAASSSDKSNSAATASAAASKSASKTKSGAHAHGPATVDDLWNSFDLEDLALLVLCAALAVVMYLRRA
jgi:SEL1 protein